MPLPFNNRAADELTHAWDDVISGDANQSSDCHQREIIDQIHALDDAPAPDRAFVASLRQHLLAASATTTASRLVTRTSQTDRSPSEVRTAPPVPPIELFGSGSRRLSELAAIAAILALLVAGVALLRPGGNEDRGRVGSSGSPTLTIQQTASEAITTPATVTSEPDGPPAGSPIELLNQPDLDGVLISLYDATLLVASYLDVSSDDLTAEFVSEPAGFAVFRVSYAIDSVPSPDEIVVDADSGLIIGATYGSHTSFGAPIAEIDTAQAREIAEAFGRATIAEFDSLSFAEESSLGWEPSKGPGDTIYTAAWFHRAPGSNAWMPTGLIVDVNLRTGLIHGFNIFQTDYDGPTEPVIPRVEATSMALAAARAEQGNPEITAGRVELSVRWIVAKTDEFGTILDGEYHLLWMVSLEGLLATNSRDRIDIDALTGEILVLPVTPAH